MSSSCSALRFLALVVVHVATIATLVAADAQLCTIVECPCINEEGIFEGSSTVPGPCPQAAGKALGPHTLDDGSMLLVIADESSIAGADTSLWCNTVVPSLPGGVAADVAPSPTSYTQDCVFGAPAATAAPVATDDTGAAPSPSPTSSASGSTAEGSSSPSAGPESPAAGGPAAGTVGGATTDADATSDSSPGGTAGGAASTSAAAPDGAVVSTGATAGGATDSESAVDEPSTTEGDDVASPTSGEYAAGVWGMGAASVVAVSFALVGWGA